MEWSKGNCEKVEFIAGANVKHMLWMKSSHRDSSSKNNNDPKLIKINTRWMFYKILTYIGLKRRNIWTRNTQIYCWRKKNKIWFVRWMGRIWCTKRKDKLNKDHLYSQKFSVSKSNNSYLFYVKDILEKQISPFCIHFMFLHSQN